MEKGHATLNSCTPRSGTWEGCRTWHEFMSCVPVWVRTGHSVVPWVWSKMTALSLPYNGKREKHLLSQQIHTSHCCLSHCDNLGVCLRYKACGEKGVTGCFSGLAFEIISFLCFAAAIVSDSRAWRYQVMEEVRITYLTARIAFMHVWGFSSKVIRGIWLEMARE